MPPQIEMIGLSMVVAEALAHFGDGESEAFELIMRRIVNANDRDELNFLVTHVVQGIYLAGASNETIAHLKERETPTDNESIREKP